MDTSDLEQAIMVPKEDQIRLAPHSDCHNAQINRLPQQFRRLTRQEMRNHLGIVRLEVCLDRIVYLQRHGFPPITEPPCIVGGKLLKSLFAKVS